MPGLTPPWLIAVMGPTGVGKTHFAELLADRLNAQLVSADAFQVYRGLDIGTSKPQTPALYEMVDIRDPDESFGAGEFCRLCIGKLKQLYAEERNVVVVGGTGFYIRALFEQYSSMKASPDPALRQSLENLEQMRGPEFMVGELQRLFPEAAASVDLRNPIRVKRALERGMTLSGTIAVKLPPFRRMKLRLDREASDLDALISNRVGSMLESGWVQEVADLLAKGVTVDMPSMRAIGYHTLVEMLEGKFDLGEAKARIVLATRQYAKRQRTWLRSEPNVVAIQLSGESGIAAAVGSLMSELTQSGEKLK